MKIGKILVSAAALFVSTACGAPHKSPQGAEDMAQKGEETRSAQGVAEGKAIVVFFSHAGDNYAVGNIEVGNTKILADYISELTGADQFEIKTSKYDGMAYRPLCDLAKKEQQNGELPPFEGEPAGLDQYDTVFVGGPVWWGTWPQVMFTFFKTYDLNGKTLIPFTTHEGSGLGRCVDDLKQAYPQATITGQFSMYGHDVRGGKKHVEKWLKSLKQ